MADMDAIDAFRRHALNPNHPCQRGSAQNPDIFFQAREACNPYYDAMPAIVQEYMDKVNAKIGTNYKLFNYYGAADAEKVIVAMGSVNDTIEETIDYLMAAGEKVGVVKVRLYRPFCAEALIDAIPESVKQITVLDRTKEPGAMGEPLYLDVVAALKGSKFDAVPVYSGRYGLGSKDTTPTQIVAVYNNTEKKVFTIGIEDDVTNLSLPLGEQLITTPEGTINCKSGDWEQTVPLEQTRTPSRSSVTTQTCTLRLTLTMIQRNPAVLPCLTCVSVRNRSNLPT